MLKSVHVIGLNGAHNFKASFHNDLNILTGKNGAGKTTLLKLMWYMMSSNRELILPEIKFQFAQIVTDKYTFTIDNRGGKKSGISTAYMEYIEGSGYSKKRNIIHDNGTIIDDGREFIDELNRRADLCQEETIFFPTFRRIEGGFSTEQRLSRRLYGHFMSRLSEAVEEYSDAMSSSNHRFVASISTADIEDFLTRKYAYISEKINAMYLEFSQFIRMRLSAENQTNQNGDEESAQKFREDIRRRLEEVNKNRESLMRPFDILTKLIIKVFKDKGINIAQNLTLGQTKSAIGARILSAGEKQMFGFLSYNAFAKNCVIFIDEPELSLHVDWQRILFKMVLKQSSSNQFVITTHSPFIYAAYPEKEWPLDVDRGGMV